MTILMESQIQTSISMGCMSRIRLKHTGHKDDYVTIIMKETHFPTPLFQWEDPMSALSDGTLTQP